MHTPYASAPPNSLRGERGLRLARLATVAYFCACAVQGLARLRGAGASAQVFAAIMRVWYGEALLFGAFWGLAALAHGLVRGGGGERAPRRKIESHDHGVLRALERDRRR